VANVDDPMKAWQDTWAQQAWRCCYSVWRTRWRWGFDASRAGVIGRNGDLARRRYVLLGGVAILLAGVMGILAGVAFLLFGEAALLGGVAVLGDWSWYGAYVRRLDRWLIKPAC
jgi:hypothetical protein